MEDYLTHEPKRRWARHSNRISGDRIWLESDRSSANMVISPLESRARGYQPFRNQRLHESRFHRFDSEHAWHNNMTALDFVQHSY